MCYKRNLVVIYITLLIWHSVHINVVSHSTFKQKGIPMLRQSLRPARFVHEKTRSSKELEVLGRLENYTVNSNHTEVCKNPLPKRSVASRRINRFNKTAGILHSARVITGASRKGPTYNTRNGDRTG